MTPVLELTVQRLINCRLALRWTAAYQHRFNGCHRSHTDEMISKIVFEYTGQLRNRKQISSHIQNLRRISSRIPEAWDRLTQQIVRAVAELREADSEDTAQIDEILGRIQDPTFVLARRNQEIQHAAFALSRRRRRQDRPETQTAPKSRIRPERIVLRGPPPSLFHKISHFASQNDHEFSLQFPQPLGRNFLALSLVNHRFRTEVLQHIESLLSFDFTFDPSALLSFCTNVQPTHRQHVRHLAIEFVDSPHVVSPSTTFGTYLSTNLPNLKSVFLTLIPRDPTRNHFFDTQWGQETEAFLSNLGDWKATIILYLRWEEDCEYFEENYVGDRGWRCIRRSEDEYQRASV